MFYLRTELILTLMFKQQADYLFSMMLGLAVTRCDLVPTSSTYSFESGGRLHLNEQNTHDIFKPLIV